MNWTCGRGKIVSLPLQMQFLSDLHPLLDSFLPRAVIYNAFSHVSLVTHVILSESTENSVYHFYVSYVLMFLRLASEFLNLPSFFDFFLVIVVQLQLSHLFSHCSSLPCRPHSHSQSSPLPMSMSPLFMFLCLPLPLLSLITLLSLPSSHCQFVLFFQVSGSILLIYLFC